MDKIIEVIKDFGGTEVSALDVYKDVFKLGQGYIQKENEKPGQFKANPIGYFKNENEDTGHFRILFEDTFEETLKEMQEADFSLLNGITYFGRRRDQNHASKCYALIFDLDGVNETCVFNFLNAAHAVNVYPIPNYIALSGDNLHLYYLFEEPIELYPYTKINLKELKYGLTWSIWNPNTSLEDRQTQGIFQAFRVLGAKTKKGAKIPRLRAFKINSHPFSMEQLIDYIPDRFHVNTKARFKESKYTLEEAKKKFPKWYEKVIVQGDKTKKKWDIPSKVHGDNPYALYDWWLRQIQQGEKGAKYGHRYFCIMCLVIYAVKCSVPFDKVKQDSYNLIPYLNQLNKDKPFTRADVDAALECYDDRYATFPRYDIATISDISIKKNKRNGRKQAKHLEGARAIRDINNDNWRKDSGRKNKKIEVLTWRIANPQGTKAQCEKETGMSRHTILKWWNYLNFERVNQIINNQ